MGQLLQIAEYSAKTVARDPSDTPAEVIIFPGVRIERGEFNLADRLKTEKVADRRD